MPERVRPRWSVVIPAYDCAAFLRDSLGGVLEQDPGSRAMEIVVVDDHSNDDCEGTVRALAGDRVKYIRQTRNVGLVANLNTCLRHATGELVHILHADDIVAPGFYSAMDAVFGNDPTLGAAFCRVTYRDVRSGTDSVEPPVQENGGLIPNALNRILLSAPQTVASVVRRDVYESVGGFDTRFTCSCEDWEMWVRIALHYPIGYEPTALATYRFMRNGSLTSVHRETGRYAADLARAHSVVDSYVPSAYRDLLSQARHASAGWILDQVAIPLSLEGKTTPSIRNVWHALRCSPSLKNFRTSFRCLTNLVQSSRQQS